MSAAGAHRDRYLVAGSLAVLIASTALGAVLGAAKLGLYVPPSGAGSLPEATKILINNLQVWALLIGATLLQPRGVPGLSKGFLPLWLTDLAIGLVVVFNLIAIGGVIGALGLDALVRILPHAPLELGAFLIVIVAYFRARDGRLDRNVAIILFALAAAMLVCGALVESFVSGGLG